MKQLQPERSRGLWVLPWIMTPDYGLGQTYPKASLLGLPVELRQRILYEALDMEEVSRRACAICPMERHLADVRRARQGKLRGMKKPHKEMTLPQANLILTICRRVGEFSCVSALVRRDMEYVKRLWQRDLETSFTPRHKESKHIVVGTMNTWLDPRRNMKANVQGKKGAVVQGKESTKCPGKCRRCRQRHFDEDTVCPMVRYDPERWERSRKKVGDWRPSVRDTFLFRGTRIVFGDD